MKSGRRTLSTASELPAHVHRRHEEPDRSDNYGHIRRASAENIGSDDVRATDTNLQAYTSTRQGKHIVVGAHWRDPKRNGYTRVKRRLLPGTRAMTRREKARTEWTWEQLRRLRRPNGERPRTYEELVTYGVQHGVVIIGELKDPAFATAYLMAQLVAVARRHAHPAWFMVLITLGPRGKVWATKRAGGRIALIFGNFTDHPKPDDWSTWSAYPDRIWGPARAERWLPA